MYLERMGGTSLTWPGRRAVIEDAQNRIEADSVANIKDVAESLGLTMPYIDDAIIIATNICKDRHYTWRASELTGWPYVFKDPNYKEQTWREKHWLSYDVIKGLITAIFSIVVALLLFQLKVRENGRPAQPPSRQKDSVGIFQKSIDT